MATSAHAAEGADQQQIEEVVVTGSRIQRANLVTSSPVTQVDREDITFSGITRLEDMVRNLPQISAEQNAGMSNGATGTATLNLRNLATERTLVLVDGRRLPPGSPLDGGQGADINQIPAGLVERVEVLTGGASSTYGSDAVAGVVNFIMVDDFQGVEVDYQFSQYMHDNDNGRIQDLLEESGFEVPSGSENDGDIHNVSVIIGGNFADDRGNVTAYATYRDIEEVTQAARDYSACSLDNSASSCSGSATSAEGTFTDSGILADPGAIEEILGEARPAAPGYTFHVEGDQFVEGSTNYNFGPLNYWQRPDERVTAGAFARYDLTDTLEVYSQLMFMDNRSVSQIAPSGAFGVTSTINCGNPFLSEQQFDAVCGNYGLDANDNQIMVILRRNVEGGNRQQDLRHTTYRGVLGLRGDFSPAWSFDVYGQYSEVSMENTYLNDLSTTRIQRALDAVVDEETGDIVCRSALPQTLEDGTIIAPVDPACVPWNVFSEGGVTQEALDYMNVPLFARGTTKQTVLSGYVTGDLTDQGIRLPTADAGVSVVLGLEYREEKLDFNPDVNFQSGDGAGQGGPTLPVSGDYDVKEVFAEVSVPLVEGAPWAEALALDLGYRYSDYSTGNETDTYKVAGSWTITQDVKLRASYQHAVRHPNLRELFQPQGLNLFDMSQDPCGSNPDAGTGPTATLEQCLNTGLSPSLYGSGGLFNPAGQYNFQQGGNAELEPEKSDTYSVGIVFTPTFLEGLSITLDYYDIEIEDAIDNLTPEFVLQQCLETGAAEFCDSVTRAPGSGSLWLGSNGFITAVDTNIGYFNVKGYDLVADYTFGIGDWGSITLSDVLSYVDTWEKQEVEGAPIVRCEGLWGGVCEFPTMEVENTLRTTWETPWNLRASLNWRYLSDVDDSTGEFVDLDSASYFDLAGIWQPVDYATVRFGINNLFDKEPEIAGAGAGPSIFGNGNTFPGIYDALGRYYFLGVTFGEGR
ncbi:MAG TPA: TonB-dependent receptor [Pseudomonadales bacterium]